MIAPQPSRNLEEVMKIATKEVEIFDTKELRGP